MSTYNIIEIMAHIKYTETEVTFSEIPFEVTLCINISNCPIHCEGCHSKHLWEDIGNILDSYTLCNLIKDNSGITCVCFLGGDRHPEIINDLAQMIKECYKDIKTAWYSGNAILSDKIDTKNFDYIKIGPYIQEKGGLNSKETNQRMYMLYNNSIYDITSTFVDKPETFDKMINISKKIDKII